MEQTHSDHYDEGYFAWQREIGRFGGKANAYKFKGTVIPSDTVIDFGCGGGYLLKQLDCSRRIGIEPNAAAHKQVMENGVELFTSPADALAKLGEQVADVIVSNNALEHTLHPLAELKSLHPLLKNQGKIHFVVPCETIKLQWEPNDLNYHLYSWSPMNIGNLFTEAGYDVLRAAPYIHKWPHNYERLQKMFGWDLFNLICRMYGRIERSWFQVEVLARKRT